MLQIDTRQAAALEVLRQDEDTRRLQAALAAVFAAERLERGPQAWNAEVEAGLREAADQGIDEPACIAIYLACRLATGNAWPQVLAFEPIRQLLASRALQQSARMFQLRHRVRPLLSDPAGAGFEPALQQLLARLAQPGAGPAAAPARSHRLPGPCDIDAVDLQATADPPVYRLQGGAWQRSGALGPPSAPMAWPPAAVLPARPPARIHLMTGATHPTAAGLRLRLHAPDGCDAAVHPQVSLHGPRGAVAWHGPDCADLTLECPAATPAPAVPGTPRPVIAAETAALVSVLGLHSCGLRLAGPGLASARTEVLVYPGDQTLMTWHRSAGTPLSWPAFGQPARGPVADRARGAGCRLECAGLPLDSQAWADGLGELDLHWTEGLARLADAWLHQDAVDHAGLQAASTLLGGSAGLAWGWSRGTAGLTSAPVFRLAAELDLVACQPGLRLHGQLGLQGSLSRVELSCAGRAVLKTSVDGPLAPAALQTSFRLPFVLAIEPVCDAATAAVLTRTGPVQGALVGSCGLRPRADGPGLQWFCTLAVEAVACGGLLTDPLGGRHAVHLPLLPDMPLVDWSLG